MQIGDKLYRYVPMGGLFVFDVFGVHQYANVTQYAVRCQSCSDHAPCELLVAEDDYKRIKIVKMLNEDEDHPQRHWHYGEEQFYTTQAAANLARGERLLADKRAEIERVEAQLKALKKTLEELTAIVETVKAGGEG